MRAGRLSDLGLVVLGGSAGTLMRYLIESAVGSPGGFPLGVFIINITGAFLLGLLLAGLEGDGGSGSERWRATRLLLGTGALGGFTTYSSLAAGTAQLLSGIDPRSIALAVSYGVATLVLGALASWLGIATGQSVRRREAGS